RMYERVLVEGHFKIEYKVYSHKNTLELEFNLLTQANTNIGIFVVGKDITNLKQAEQKLIESEFQYRSLYENTTLGIYRTTPDGRIILGNPSLIRMLEYNSFEELAKRNLEEEGFEPNYDRQRFIEQIERDGK